MAGCNLFNKLILLKCIRNTVESFNEGGMFNNTPTPFPIS